MNYLFDIKKLACTTTISDEYPILNPGPELTNNMINYLKDIITALGEYKIGIQDVKVEQLGNIKENYLVTTRLIIDFEEPLKAYPEK